MPTPSQTCCPTGYGFISNAANPNGTCQSFGSPFTYVSPIDCPCCPDGYVYNQNLFIGGIKGLCVNITNSNDVVQSVPCIPCVCITPVTSTCGTCGTSGERIVFQYNFFTRTCSNCNPINFCPPGGSLNKFIPYFYASPDPSGFTLK